MAGGSRAQTMRPSSYPSKQSLGLAALAAFPVALRTLVLGGLLALTVAAPAGAATVTVKPGAAFNKTTVVKQPATVRGYLGLKKQRDGYNDIQLAGAKLATGGKLKLTLGVPAGTPLGRYRLHLCADEQCRRSGKVNVVDDGVKTEIRALSDAFPETDESGDEEDIARTSASLCKAVHPAQKFTEKAALASLDRFLTTTAGADAMRAFATSPDSKSAGAARAAAVAAITVGSPGGALAASLRVQQLQPRRMEPLLNVAGLAVSVGRPNEAMALLDAAATRVEDGGAPMGIAHRSSALATRAAALNLLGRYKEAQRVADAVLAGEPALTEVATTAGVAHACLGDITGAVQLVRKGRRRNGGVPRADISGGKASKLRPIQLPALPVNALAMNDYYKDEMQRAFSELGGFINRRNQYEAAVRAYEDGLPLAARKHLNGIQSLAYRVVENPAIEAHRVEINRQSTLIADEICVIFGDFCSADSKYDTWQDEAGAACAQQGSGCYKREMLARCEPAAKLVHQSVLAHVTAIDREQQALHAISSTMTSGYAAHLFDDSAHRLVLLAIEEEESALHAEAAQAIQGWTGSLSARGEYCVSQPVEPAQVGASTAAGADDAGKCPDWLKGVSISIDLGPAKAKVSCKEIKLGADLGKGWITAFGEVAYDPRAGRLTVVGGSKASAKLEGVGKADLVGPVSDGQRPGRRGRRLARRTERLRDRGSARGQGLRQGRGHLVRAGGQGAVRVAERPLRGPRPRSGAQPVSRRRRSSGGG